MARITAYLKDGTIRYLEPTKLPVIKTEVEFYEQGIDTRYLWDSINSQWLPIKSFELTDSDVRRLRLKNLLALELYIKLHTHHKVSLHCGKDRLTIAFNQALIDNEVKTYVAVYYELPKTINLTSVEAYSVSDVNEAVKAVEERMVGKPYEVSNSGLHDPFYTQLFISTHDKTIDPNKTYVVNSGKSDHSYYRIVLVNESEDLITVRRYGHSKRYTEALRFAKHQGFSITATKAFMEFMRAFSKPTWREEAFETLVISKQCFETNFRPE